MFSILPLLAALGQTEADRAVETALGEGSVVLGLASPDHLKSTLQRTLKYVAEHKQLILYLSMTRPCDLVLKELKALQASPHKFIIVDTMSGQLKKGSDKTCVFSAGIDDLTDVALQVNELIDKRKPDAVILDNIALPLLYADEERVLKFIYSVITHLRTSNAAALMLMVKGEKHQDFTREIYMLVDKVVEYG